MEKVVQNGFVYVCDGQRIACEADPHFAAELTFLWEHRKRRGYEPLQGAVAQAAWLAWLLQAEYTPPAAFRAKPDTVY